MNCNDNMVDKYGWNSVHLSNNLNSALGLQLTSSWLYLVAKRMIHEKKEFFVVRKHYDFLLVYSLAVVGPC